MQSWKSQKKKKIERNPGGARRNRRLYAVLAKPEEIEIVRISGEARRTRKWYAILEKPEEEDN
jgi:hypothetical protein